MKSPAWTRSLALTPLLYSSTDLPGWTATTLGKPGSAQSTSNPNSAPTPLSRAIQNSLDVDSVGTATFSAKVAWYPDFRKSRTASAEINSTVQHPWP
eukprot:CAMPEP_0179018974 /NCGR_PEP_ID=MMETSP0796-20121207/4629_1 /TAXON_ID=73915 /ORGANISM="Pyrodinium bahamense, Strain pbaha01" /LENGTH=96 /DNA_ID=CAMNT_0020714747 /DNA_START=23 /DNA_END=310 /DNA_ORIENTATION=-